MYGIYCTEARLPWKQQRKRRDKLIWLETVLQGFIYIEPSKLSTLPQMVLSPSSPLGFSVKLIIFMHISFIYLMVAPNNILLLCFYHYTAYNWFISSLCISYIMMPAKQSFTSRSHTYQPTDDCLLEISINLLDLHGMFLLENTSSLSRMCCINTVWASLAFFWRDRYIYRYIYIPFQLDGSSKIWMISSYDWSKVFLGGFIVHVSPGMNICSTGFPCFVWYREHTQPFSALTPWAAKAAHQSSSSPVSSPKFQQIKPCPCVHFIYINLHSL